MRSRIASFRFLLLLFFLFYTVLLKAVTVSGVVTDEDNNPFPYATVYVKGTTNGTVTNNTGKYFLELGRGKYILVFKYVGYETKEIDIIIENEPIELNVKLSESYAFQEVVVKPGEEDPAYRIIRNAIANRKKYLKEAKAYSCDVYVKGVQKMESMPGSVMGMKIHIPGLKEDGSGIVYLSESVSKLSFEQPDKLKEEIISSKVSGDDRGFSWNRASEMDNSFYENNIIIDVISDRGFVSPISSNAMLYYRYKLEGKQYENNLVINKIKVIPKRKNDPAFRGHIYITDTTWRIYSADLYLSKDAQIDYLDTLRIRQLYFPVNEDIWMFQSQSYEFRFNVLGFKGAGSFIGVYSNYDVTPAFKKRHFTNEIVKVHEEANEKGEAYWESVRPVELTEIEKEDYIFKDSLAEVFQSKEYLDSIDQVTNSFRLSNLLLRGYTYRQRHKKQFFSFSSLPFTLGFNSVEGTYLRPRIRYGKDLKNSKYLRGTNFLRYGFANRHFNASASVDYFPKQQKLRRYNFSAGKEVVQFNREDPISPFINSIYSLYFERNYMKLYERAFGAFSYRNEFFNGVLGNIKLTYEKRFPLRNASDFTFFDRENRTYTINRPEIKMEPPPLFTQHKAAIVEVNFRLRYKQQYESHPDRKLIKDSDYPDLFITYKKAIPGIFGSLPDYDFLQLDLVGKFNFNLWGSMDWALSSGGFLSKKNVQVMDYHHFNGNQTLLSSTYLKSFQLLPYYQNSTTATFVEAHLEHHFNGFITNKIPIFRKTKFTVVGALNSFITSANISYTELSLGLENIFKLLRVDWVQSLDNTEGFKTGVRIGIKLDL